MSISTEAAAVKSLRDRVVHTEKLSVAVKVISLLHISFTHVLLGILNSLIDRQVLKLISTYFMTYIMELNFIKSEVFL